MLELQMICKSCRSNNHHQCAEKQDTHFVTFLCICQICKVDSNDYVNGRAENGFAFQTAHPVDSALMTGEQNEVCRRG